MLKQAAISFPQLLKSICGKPGEISNLERIISGSLAGPSRAAGQYASAAAQRGQLLRSFRTVANGPSLAQRHHRNVLRWEAGRTYVSRRLFSTGESKKGFQNFYPKNQKGAKPSSSRPNGEKGPEQNTPPQGALWLAAGALYLIFSTAMEVARGNSSGTKEISFQDFKNSLLANGLVAKVEISNGTTAKVWVKPDREDSPSQLKYYFVIGSVDSFERKLDEAQHDLGIASENFIPVRYVREVSLLNSFLEMAPSLLLMGVVFWWFSRQMRKIDGGALTRGARGGSGRGGPGGFFGMAKANISVLDKNAKGDKITFKDVAGCDEAKVEIMEFVDFLKNPGKYNNLGAKIPKGALLVGPPGTGKTLLAKATAGEANVPFLSISGSDFMEMFVGVGPARVRDLFAQARSQSPSIIFIDEIDAIGRARGRGGMAGGHDERENTLNQLLVEMDGFATTQGVVVLGGTNRADILDRALMRPGRFDRMITVDTPDIKGREQIFRVHLGKLKLTNPIEFYSERLAALTPGFAGADIANVCNEAALVAARANAEAVSMEHFEQAIDRVIGGLEKKNKVISAEERKTVAYHEAGHAVVGWFLQYADPLLKVSIVPRGTAALGFAQYLPNENLLLTKEHLIDRICMALGGRAAEEVMLGRISTGAVNDLEKVTQMTYSQVAVYGMNDKVGLVSFPMDKERFDKPYSDETARMIDVEVREFVASAYARTVEMLKEKKELVEAMAQALLHKEVLGLEDIEGLLGKRPFVSEEMRNIDRYRHGFEPKAEEGGEEGEKKEEGAEDGEDGQEGGFHHFPPGVVVAT